SLCCCCFFFQAEDGIRDFHVTGVQTCALPIWRTSESARRVRPRRHVGWLRHWTWPKGERTTRQCAPVRRPPTQPLSGQYDRRDVRREARVSRRFLIARPLLRLAR